MIVGPAAALALLGGSGVADARPTDLTGIYAYDETDVVEYVDGPLELVRVHYSVAGTNEVLLTDADEDGVPDLAWDTAVEAELVLEAFADAGFRLPLTEAELGLDDLGGSPALDFYLLDFAGTGDGQFATDRCSGGVCAGHMLMENDFRGYGYPDLGQAVRTLTSHELFHGVQYAYAQDQPGWLSEGTAVWAEYLYDPDSYDYRAWCGRYLEEPDRSLDRPPSGAFTGWEYGTGLWFGFLDAFLGPDTMVILQEELAARGGEADLDALDAAVVEMGSDLEESFATFTSWNLATGDRAGAAESYPYAEDLDELVIEAEGSSIVDDERIYPLASVTLRLDHPGGPLWWGTLDETDGLHYAVHPVADGGEDGPVTDAVASGPLPGEQAVELADVDAGGVFVILSHPARADNSVSIDFCLGTEADVAPCRDDAGGDTGGEDPGESPKGGCAVAPGSAGLLALLVGPLAVLGRRRR